MKPKMSRVQVMALSSIMRKGHAHRSKKDYDRKKSKQKLAKDIKAL